MPSRQVEKALKWGELEAMKFIELSSRDFQNRLYHKFSKISELGSYTVALLAQRFIGSCRGKAVIPFNSQNSKFLNENGCWFVEVALTRGKKPRLRVPIAKTDNKYYDVIENCVGLPFAIVREDDRWYAYISAPNNIEPNSNVVGIDFNEATWVASKADSRPLFFDVRGYAHDVNRLQDLISRANRDCPIHSRCRYCKKKCNVQQLYDQRTAILKRCQGDFLAEIMKRWGICTLGIECIDVMYAMVRDTKKTRSVRNWLNSKLCMRKFEKRATSKGFDVVEVDPAYTTQRCYRCGEVGEIYGDHFRLFKCKCGLRDYNRDLNASRNIAKLALNATREEGMSARVPDYVSSGLPVNSESSSESYMVKEQDLSRGVERAEQQSEPKDASLPLKQCAQLLSSVTMTDTTRLPIETLDGKTSYSDRHN
jgi:putative transposase